MSRVVDVDEKIKAIIKKAADAIQMMPADGHTVANFRSIISSGVSSLKTKGYIKGYRIDVDLTPQNTIVGAVTYTPTQQVDDVIVSFNMVTAVDKAEGFDRAMKGI